MKPMVLGDAYKEFAGETELYNRAQVNVHLCDVNGEILGVIQTLNLLSQHTIISGDFYRAVIHATEFTVEKDNRFIITIGVKMFKGVRSLEKEWKHDYGLVPVFELEKQVGFMDRLLIVTFDPGLFDKDITPTNHVSYNGSYIMLDGVFPFTVIEEKQLRYEEE